MTFWELAVVTISCVVANQPACFPAAVPVAQAQVPQLAPTKVGEAVDVALSAKAALVWDVATGEELYARAADERRPIASLNKLLSVLIVRQKLAAATIVLIPPEVRQAQRAGAHIKLIPGNHASVQELLAASLIASANDAMVTLAIATSGSEEAFVELANSTAPTLGLRDTKIANATGLSGGEQYSTARDVRRLLHLVASDNLLQPYLAQGAGTLSSTEGSRHPYTTTNKLLGTYVPITAAKTGYTTEAGQNLVITTTGERGQQLGAVVLGSDERFQDMKVLVEWIWRNFAWPQTNQ